MKTLLTLITGFFVGVLIAVIAMSQDVRAAGVFGIAFAFLLGFLLAWFGMLLFGVNVHDAKKKKEDEDDDWWRKGKTPPWESGQ